MLNAIESVSIGESFALAGVSMSIIMAVLACIMLLIYLMSAIFKFMEKHNPEFKAKIDAFFTKKSKKTEATEEIVVVEEQKDVVTARGSCGNITLSKVTDREAAMIMAIVADQMQTPLNELRFKSIKKIEDQLGDRINEVEVEKGEAILVDEYERVAPVAAPAPVATAPVAAPVATAPTAQASANAVKSPLPGVVVAVKAQVGQAVKAGDTVVVIEAMKMENEIVAPTAGTVKAILVQKGTSVQTDAPLFEIA